MDNVDPLDIKIILSSEIPFKIDRIEDLMLPSGNSSHKKPAEKKKMGEIYTEKGNPVMDIENKAFVFEKTGHESRKIFTCKNCGNVFSRKDSLNRHIKTIHHGVKTLNQSKLKHSNATIRFQTAEPQILKFF